MVLAELIKSKHGLYKSCGIECFEGIMLEPCLLQAWPGIRSAEAGSWPTDGGFVNGGCCVLLFFGKCNNMQTITTTCEPYKYNSMQSCLLVCRFSTMLRSLCRSSTSLAHHGFAQAHVRRVHEGGTADVLSLVARGEPGAKVLLYHHDYCLCCVGVVDINLGRRVVVVADKWGRP